MISSIFSSAWAFVQANAVIIISTTVIGAGIVGAGVVTTQYIQQTMNQQNSASNNRVNPEDKANSNANIGGNYGAIRCERGKKILNGICQ